MVAIFRKMDHAALYKNIRQKKHAKRYLIWYTWKLTIFLINIVQCIVLQDFQKQYIVRCIKELKSAIYRVCQKKERHFKYICKVANN